MRTEKVHTTHSDNRVISHPSGVRALILKHRMFTLAAAVLLAVMAAIGVANANGLMGQNEPDGATHETHVKGNSVTTEVSTPDVSQPGGQPSGLSDVQTNVTVNGESIEVPKNGSTSKTITNDNGTTRVDISSNSSTNGSSVSSSVRTNTDSRSTHTQNHIDINSSSP